MSVTDLWCEGRIFIYLRIKISEPSLCIDLDNLIKGRKWGVPNQQSMYFWIQMFLFSELSLWVSNTIFFHRKYKPHIISEREVPLKWRLILKRNQRDNQKDNIVAGSKKITWRHDIRDSEHLYRVIKIHCLKATMLQCSLLNVRESYRQCLEAHFTTSEVKLSLLSVSISSFYKILQGHKMFLEYMAFQNIINIQGWDLGCQWPDMLKILFREADLNWSRYLSMFLFFTLMKTCSIVLL